jgi:glucose/arabinose dehydrogenase
VRVHTSHATRRADAGRRRIARLVPALLATLGLLGLVGCDLPSGFHDYVVFDGLDRPTAVAFSPDGRVFVTEKRGVVKVFDTVSDTTPTVVADLRTATYNSWDRGMLGLALHPQFPSVPDLFVAYTYDAAPGGAAPLWGQPDADVDSCPDPPGATEDGCVVTGRISRLRFEGTTWDGEEHVLVEDFCSQYPSHTIGTLAFGADGALYASAGDGADFNTADSGQRGGNPRGDPPLEGGALRSQDVRTAGDPLGLDGTIIRIDPATGEGLPTNPLWSSPDPNARRVVAAGLRNPFRFAVRPGTDELWIGDVGWRTWEEIDVTRGDDGTLDNFGWPCREGAGVMAEYDQLDLPVCEELYSDHAGVAPVFTYRHGQEIDEGENCATGQGSSISGLAFAPVDSPYPEDYRGGLFFADASRGCIWVMGTGSDGLPDPATTEVFDQGAGTPVDLTFGPGGELWVVDLYGGSIHRLGYSATNTSPQAAVTAAPAAGDPPLEVVLDGTASSDGDPGDELTYAWDTDGDGELDDGDTPTVAVTYDTVGTRAVRLRVTDVAGAFDDATTTVRVGTSPPSPSIALPQDGATAAVGATVDFAGSATTVDGTPLPASALSWSLDVLHCTAPDACHHHPDAFAATGVASGSFTMPDHDYPAAVELALTATWQGEQATATRQIDYTTAMVTLTGHPEVPLTLAGTTGLPPVSRRLPVGSTVTVSAPPEFPVGDHTLRFKAWSDGGASTHTVVVPPEGLDLEARYRRGPSA